MLRSVLILSAVSSIFAQDLEILQQVPNSAQQQLGGNLLVWDPLQEQRSQSDFLVDANQAEPYFLDWKYHKYDSMTRFLRKTTSTFPNLTALYSIGKSVQGEFLLIILVNCVPI